MFGYVNTFLYLCGRKSNQLTPKTRKGTKNMDIVTKKATLPTEAVVITLSPSEAIGLKNYLTCCMSNNRTYANDFNVVMKLVANLCEQCDDYETIDEIEWRAKMMLQTIKSR